MAFYGENAACAGEKQHITVCRGDGHAGNLVFFLQVCAPASLAAAVLHVVVLQKRTAQISVA